MELGGVLKVCIYAQALPNFHRTAKLKQEVGVCLKVICILLLIATSCFAPNYNCPLKYLFSIK